MTTLDDEASTILEPGASPPRERLDALKRLADAGISTWAFVGPLVPGFVDADSLAGLLASVKEAGAGKVLVDKLRLKPGLWQRMEPALLGKPDVLDACRQALFNDPGVFNGLREQAVIICKDLKLECEFKFLTYPARSALARAKPHPGYTL